MRKIIATLALTLAVGGVGLVATSASAKVANDFGSNDIRDNSVKSRDIKDGTIKTIDLGKNLKTKVNAKAGQVGPQGPVGPAGAAGKDGATGPQGPAGSAGTDGMLGAYYSVAFYNAGDTNAGAVASVACSNITDVAISGGVQTLGLDATPLDNNTPVSSSFPGRMDYSVNAPRPNRLDGWIIQFGGNAGATSDNSPLRAKVWALCLPNAEIPVVQTYQQTD